MSQFKTPETIQLVVEVSTGYAGRFAIKKRLKKAEYQAVGKRYNAILRSRPNQAELESLRWRKCCGRKPKL
jgi:hypothetical protein